ncbi:MAG TPA: hypothetical protein DCW68_02840 [Rhodospirillaceae bacterium]|nr:hypothetical protein [Rhodospirillaceae bacterium]
MSFPEKIADTITSMAGKVSPATKTILAGLLGAAMASASLFALVSLDKANTEAEALRKDIAKTKRITEENTTLQDRLTRIGGPRVHVDSYTPEKPQSPDAWSLDTRVNRKNELCFIFSEKAAKDYEQGHTHARWRVHTGLRSPNFRKLMANPYPILR